MHRVLVILHAFLVMAAASVSGTGDAAGSPEPPVSEPLPYVRLFCDAGGESHFSDELLPFTLVDFAPPAPPISVSEALPAQAVRVISSPPGWHGDWHPAPRRQFMVVLAGELEVEASDGEVRQFPAGSVILVEDTSCRGHISRVTGKTRCYMATVPLEGE